MTTREVLRQVDELALARSVAGMLATRIAERLTQEDVVHVVLTGGGIGTAVLAELARDPVRDAVDWTRLHLWWGDERFEATGSPDRNETGARAALLDHVPLDPRHVHSMAGPDLVGSAEESAERYAAELRSLAPRGAQVPDFAVVLLGIGPDAHVASIFPELPAARIQDATVAAVHGSPKPPPTRVTLTFPAINAAREVWVLAAGDGKADAIRLACDPSAGPWQVPAAGVHGVERTLFCVDEAAASRLPADMGRTIA